MKVTFIPGTWFDKDANSYEVTHRWTDGKVRVRNQIGKTFEVHEDKLNQSLDSGEITNHRLNLVPVSTEVDMMGHIVLVKKAE